MNDTRNEECGLRDEAKIYLGAISIAVGFVATVGNSLVIAYIMAMRRDMWTKVTWVKLSLAVSDLLYSTNEFWYNVYELIAAPLAPAVNAHYALRGMFVFTSYGSVCLMATQRYYAIRHPFKYANISHNAQKLLIFSLWCAGAIPVALHYIILHFPVTTNALSYLMIACFSAVPFGCTIISTLAMLIMFLVANKKSKNTFRSDLTASRKRDNAKVVKMTCLIAIVYVFTHAPSLASYIYEVTLESSSSALGPQTCISLLARTALNFSGVSNILAYSFFDKDFQGFIKGLLKSSMQCIGPPLRSQVT